MFGIATTVCDDDVADSGAVLDVAVFDYFFKVADVDGVGVFTIEQLNFSVSLQVYTVKKLYVIVTFADGVHFVVTGILEAANAVKGEITCVVVAGASELGLV